MRKIRVTYTLVVDLHPMYEDPNEAELQAIEAVCDEPMAYVSDGNVACTTEWVEVDE